MDFSTRSTIRFIVSTQILRAQATSSQALSHCRAVHCTLEPHAPSQSMTESFTAHGRWENGEIAHFSPGPAVVRRFPGRSVPVSLRTKIRAESSSNGSSGQPRTAHDELRPALREASPNLALRRPWGQLLRQRQNDPVRVGGTY